MKRTTQGYDILLMIDANEDVGSNPGSMSLVIASAGLFDLIQARHQTERYPNTFARGTKRINFIYGTENVKQHCVASGILPFGYGYPSDHRAIFAHINISKNLATEVHPSETLASRGLTAATPKERERFMEELDLHYQSQNLYKKLQDL
jgi:hypothetical protein